GGRDLARGRRHARRPPPLRLGRLHLPRRRPSRGPYAPARSARRRLRGRLGAHQPRADPGALPIGAGRHRPLRRLAQRQICLVAGSRGNSSRTRARRARRPALGARSASPPRRRRRGLVGGRYIRRIRPTTRPWIFTWSGPKIRVSYFLLAGSRATELPFWRKRFRVTSLSSMSATTMAPFSAVSARRISTVSPSKIPASIIESPSTVSA